MKEPEYRLAKQDSHCRVCDGLINRREDFMVTFYSIRDRGQHIHICPGCVRFLYTLVPNE